MAKITVQERISDICARTGLSESIVRRVLEGERQSVVSSLKKGEQAQLIGRCTFIPGVGAKLGNQGEIVQMITIKCKPAIGLINEVRKDGLFKEEVEEEKGLDELEGIRVAQIDALLG